MVNNKRNGGGVGDENSGLAFGGESSGGTNLTTECEKWSGSTWATTGSLTGAKWSLAGCGNTSDALCIGGGVATTEKWSGTA